MKMKMKKKKRRMRKMMRGKNKRIMILIKKRNQIKWYFKFVLNLVFNSILIITYPTYIIHVIGINVIHEIRYLKNSRWDSIREVLTYVQRENVLSPTQVRTL